MPTYIYRCSVCDDRQETVHSIILDPLIECLLCASPCVRVMCPPGIVYKGRGFYHNDKEFGIADESGVVWGNS